MKIKSLLIAASLALVPATIANADDAKKEALKKAKEAAKEKAKETAKEKIEEKKETHEKKVEAKKATAKADAEAAAKAAEEEKATHAKNLGAIERLDQIAGVTANAELTAVVTRLKEKEAKRAALAAPPAAPEPPAKK